VAFLGDPGIEPSFMTDYVGDIINYLFDLDMVLTFITACEDSEGRIETRLSHIALNYFKSWFFVDLCANFPFETLSPLMNKAASVEDISSDSLLMSNGTSSGVKKFTGKT
jgi:hypothetical protein